MEKNYPEHYEHLKELMGRRGETLPGPMNGFSRLHEEAAADGALDAKTKELVALSIAVKRPV